MAEPRRHDPAQEAKLDDLLGEGEPAPPRSGVRILLLRAVLLTVVGSAVVYAPAGAAGLAPSLMLIVAVVAGAAAIHAAAASVPEARWWRASDALYAHGSARAGDASGTGDDEAGPADRGDGMLAAVWRWDRRLAGADARHADGRTWLAQLADERLRQRHGLTRASDPGRARALLGDPLWTLLHTTPGGPPDPAELERAVRRLESL